MAFTPTKKIGLTGKILIGMAAGILFGLLLRHFFPDGDLNSEQSDGCCSRWRRRAISGI